MASGVAVDKQCKAEFESIKMKRSYRYVIYRLSDDLRDIVVDKTAPRDASHADLVEDLQLASKSHQCRYAVYEAEYTKNDTAKSKLVFVYWAPENASVKQKMVYSSSKEKLRSELGPGISMMLQANDDGDIELGEVQKKLLDNDKYM